MSFGTAFNVASNVYGIYSSNKEAKRAAEWAAYNSALQRDANQQSQNLMRINLDQQARAREDAKRQYERDMAFFNDQLNERMDIQRYQREGDLFTEQFQQEQNQRALAQERELAKAAREQRMFDLEQIARDETIRKEERQFALQELERERRIAKEERAEQREYITSGQKRLDDEYALRNERFMEDRGRKMEERQREIDIANDILSQTSRTRDNLREIIAAGGNLQSPELAGEEEIGERADEKFQVLNQEIERAVDQMLSKTESDLIRRGVGTDGADSNARRAEVLARIAPAVQKAGQSAYSEALAEISGENKIKTDRFGLLRQALADKLSNEVLAGTTGLNTDANMRRTSSGILDRQVGSAQNNYLSMGPTKTNQKVTGPLDINSLSKIYGAPSSGIGAMANLSNPFAQRSNYSAYQGMNLPTYTSEPFNLKSANDMVGGMYDNATSAYDAAMQRGQKAGETGGKYLQNAFEGLGGFLDDRYGGTIDEAGNYSGGSNWYKSLFNRS